MKNILFLLIDNKKLNIDMDNKIIQ